MRGRGQPRWRVLPLEMLSTCTCYSQLHWRLFGYVSLLYWTMCRIFMGPRGHFLFDHVSRCCPFTFRFFIRPRGLTTSFHVSDFLLAHVSCPSYFTCHALVRPRVVFLFDHVACPGCTTCSTINSS